MKRFSTLALACAMCTAMWADRYEVKYEVRSSASTTRTQTILELKNATAEEAIEALVRRGTIRKENIHKVKILEIKKK